MTTNLPSLSLRAVSILMVFASPGLLTRPILAAQPEAIAASAVIANVQEIHQVIQVEQQSYEALLQQAETLATQLINQSLAQPGPELIRVQISGDREGQAVPLLFVRVTRSDWQAQSNLRQWAKFSGGYARQLLGFAPSQSGPIVAASLPTYDASGRVNPLPSGLSSGASLEERDAGYR